MDAAYNAGWEVSHGWQAGGKNEITREIPTADEKNVDLVQNVGLRFRGPGAHTFLRSCLVLLTSPFYILQGKDKKARTFDVALLSPRIHANTPEPAAAITSRTGTTSFGTAITYRSSRPLSWFRVGGRIGCRVTIARTLQSYGQHQQESSYIVISVKSSTTDLLRGHAISSKKRRSSDGEEGVAISRC